MTEHNTNPHTTGGMHTEPQAQAQAPQSSQLEQIAQAYVTEQRRGRRWSIAFRCVQWVVIIAVLVALFQIDVSFFDYGEEFDIGVLDEEHIAVVDIKGVIAGDDDGDTDAGFVNDMLERAFSNEQVAAVVLHINSPGGSPVQAALIYDAVMRHKKRTEKPVYAVIEDIGASAAYYIASAADEIYANRNSIVGSIGVILSTVGYQKLFEKIGLQSRTQVAGKYKDIGNPARPETDFEKRFLQNTINKIHENFIADVKRGRKDRLKGTYEQLFSGLFWTAQEAKSLGLIDQVAHMQQVKEATGVDTLVYYKEHSLFDDVSFDDVFDILANIANSLFKQQHATFDLIMR